MNTIVLPVVGRNSIRTVPSLHDRFASRRQKLDQNRTFPLGESGGKVVQGNDRHIFNTQLPKPAQLGEPRLLAKMECQIDVVRQECALHGFSIVQVKRIPEADSAFVQLQIVGDGIVSRKSLLVVIQGVLRSIQVVKQQRSQRQV